MLRVALLLVFGWLIYLSIEIVATGRATTDRSADVAIVLGAAVHDDRPSPVFEERIRHGIDLFKSGRVRRLLFTGGSAGGDEAAESAIARGRALTAGVPEAAILTEAESHTTLQNLIEAQRAMQAQGLTSAIVVSDPLHLDRAMRMCLGLALDCASSPTPTTRYVGLLSQSEFLARELFYTNVYLVMGR